MWSTTGAARLTEKSSSCSVARTTQRMSASAGSISSRLVGVLVGHPDLVRVEEQPRVRHRDGDVVVVDRVEPEERRIGRVAEERVSRPGKPDQPVREIEDRVVAHLDLPEPSAADQHPCLLHV